MGKRFHVRYSGSFLEKEAEFTTRQKREILQRCRAELRAWIEAGDGSVMRIQFPMFGYGFRLDFDGRDEWLLLVVGTPRRGQRVDGHPITAARRKREDCEAREEKRTRKEAKKASPNTMDKRIDFAHSFVLYNTLASRIRQTPALVCAMVGELGHVGKDLTERLQSELAQASQWRPPPNPVLTELSQRFFQNSNFMVPRSDVLVFDTRPVQIGKLILRAPLLRRVDALAPRKLWDKALFGELAVESEMLS